MTGPSGYLGRQRLWVASLLLAALFVVFILPQLISGPAKDSEIDTDTDNTPLPTATVQNDLAPSLIAEKTRYRQQSQTLLASVLALRDTLLDQSIERWAQPQFSRALTLVDEGDNQYSFGKYNQSITSYQRALEQLQTLEQLATVTLEKSLIDATEAIARAEPDDIALVSAALALALAIAPSDDRVQKLDQQAIDFSDLVAALARGDLASAKGHHQRAKEHYAQALAIIPDHQRAQRALNRTQVEIDQNNFVALMSDGYDALNNNDFDAALENFTRARGIYGSHSMAPSAADAPSLAAEKNLNSVAQAIAQLDNRRSQYRVNQQITIAEGLEKQEQWQQAQTIYQNLLATDASLIDIKARLVQVRVRAELDQQITSILNDPLRLANQRAYIDAQTILNSARGIKRPQEKLQRQIEQLIAVIERARVAIDVPVISDNQTEVTVYRVAKLGTFKEMRVQLVPGRYIIVGTRQGYRDVRVELIVEATGEIQPLDISCTEQI